MQKQGGGNSDPVCGSCPFPGTGACPFYARGGACGCGGRVQQGGSCPCSGTPLLQTGGGCRQGLFKGGRRTRTYKATKRNLKYLKKWKRGTSIGFTMTSSLKAKGLIPRSSKTMKGKRVLGRKYR